MYRLFTIGFLLVVNSVSHDLRAPLRCAPDRPPAFIDSILRA